MWRRRFAVQGLLLWLLASSTVGVGASWCIVRSGAPARSVLAGLDYACSPAGGADCAPIQPGTGLCFLPNTLAAHASYAYNSAFQRTGACDFAGTATLTITDPSQ